KAQAPLSWRRIDCHAAGHRIPTDDLIIGERVPEFPFRIADDRQTRYCTPRLGERATSLATLTDAWTKGNSRSRRQAMTVSSAVKNRLDNLEEGKQSLLTFTGVDPLKGGSQCPWIGSLESIPTSSLTTRMAGPGIRVRVAPLPCVSSYSEGLSCRPPDARAARRPSAP